MFGGPAKTIRRVESTNILARSLPSGRQNLVYSMNVAARSPVAMILPLPVPPGAGEDAVRFIDMKDYPRFFHDLDRAFPPLVIPASKGGWGGGGGSTVRPKLVVHEVGDFVASFVPTQNDFDRLDERFRLSDAIWDALPKYRDYGFAVFQLADLGTRGLAGRLFGWAKKKTIHPMAFEFPRRDASELFFPTVHVHDGVVRERARFDHQLYAQFLDPRQEPPDTFWLRNDRPLSERLEPHASKVLDLHLPAFTQPVIGERANDDIVVTARTG